MRLSQHATQLTTQCGRSIFTDGIILSALYQFHYSDVIMSALASQITGVSIVYSPVLSSAYQRKHQSPASLVFVKVIHRSPTQRASNAENVSIWWRHHVARARTVSEDNVTVLAPCVHVSLQYWIRIGHPSLQWRFEQPMLIPGSCVQTMKNKIKIK